MSQDEELRALAERYLDLWERQALLLADSPVTPQVFAAWMGALAASGGDTPGSDDDSKPG